MLTTELSERMQAGRQEGRQQHMATDPKHTRQIKSLAFVTTTTNRKIDRVLMSGLNKHFFLRLNSFLLESFFFVASFIA